MSECQATGAKGNEVWEEGSWLQHSGGGAALGLGLVSTGLRGCEGQAGSEGAGVPKGREAAKPERKVPGVRHIQKELVSRKVREAGAGVGAWVGGQGFGTRGWGWGWGPGVGAGGWGPGAGTGAELNRDGAALIRGRRPFGVSKSETSTQLLRS